jgi:hypothetical protein
LYATCMHQPNSTRNHRPPNYKPMMSKTSRTRMQCY